MCAQTRTDDHTITANLTIVIREDDDIPDFRTESEHVAHLAKEHLEEKFNTPRGSYSIGVEQVEDFDEKNVWEATCNIIY